MGSKIGLAELKMAKEDGSLFSRLEMEKKLREETVYHRRLRAFKLGLPNKVAQHMFPISVTHWLLDHWVQTKQITGEVLGIRAEFDADDNKEYVQQLAQRLMIFVEYGLAQPPVPGEGIDMSFVPGQPPGFPPMPPAPNGQQGAPSFVPPPPPPMPGMGMPQGMPQQMMPQMPQPQAPQGYPQVPQGFPPGMPQQGMPPQPPMPPMPQQPPQQAYSPPVQPQQGYPQQPGFPPQPQQPQQTQQGQMSSPTKVDPTRQWGQAGKREDGSQRNRRTKEELAEDATYEAWVQAGGDRNVGMGQAPQQPQQAQQPQQMQMPQMQQPSQAQPQQAPPQMLAPPNPFGGSNGPLPNQPFGAPQGLPQMPQMGAPIPQVQAPAPQQAPQNNEELLNRISLLESGVAMIIRLLWQVPGGPDLYQVLTEVCKVRPQ